MRRLLYISLSLITLSCEKVTYYPDEPRDPARTTVLAHRGGRTGWLRENTMEAAKYALPITDGLEVDVQLSKDRTVWLSHSSVVEGCGQSMRCFAEMRDTEIESIDSCNGKDISYTRLEDIFSYMVQNNIRKNISIDLKGWGPCSANSLDIEGMMRLEAEEIIKLAERYSLSEYILFETQVTTVLVWIKAKKSGVKAYYVSFGDYEKGMLTALKYDLDGISFKSNFKDSLDSEKMALLHKKGLQLMAWNIPDTAYANYLRSIDVDILQVDL